MGRKLRTIIAVIALVAGVCLALYPIVSNALYQYEQSQLVQQQFAAVQDLGKDQLADEKASAVNYNKKLLAGKVRVTDPFDASNTGVSQADYLKELNIAGDGIMGSINIPKIGVSLPIYHGTEDEVLQKGVGHVNTTSLPVGGSSTHCVLAGHTGLPSIKVFDALDCLEVGDMFYLTVLGDQLVYKIYDIEVVLPDDTDSLVVQKGRDLVTLVTCTPYGVNSHRLLVHAERTDEAITDEPPSGVQALLSGTNQTERLTLIVVLIVLLLALLFVIWRLRRMLKEKKRAQLGQGSSTEDTLNKAGAHDRKRNRH